MNLYRFFDRSQKDLAPADVGQDCAHCGGWGWMTICHNDCPPDRAKQGCGDCYDECSWCLGFGKRWRVTHGYLTLDNPMTH